MEATLVPVKQNHLIAETYGQDYSLEKLALSSVNVGASDGSVVLKHAAFQKDALNFESVCGDDRSCAYWDEQSGSQDDVLLQVDWNVSYSSADDKDTPQPQLVSKNLVLLLHHAFKQGLPFKLQGIGLAQALGQTAKSTRLLLASSRLANFFKGAKGHCNAGNKTESHDRLSMLEFEGPKDNPHGTRRELRITSPGLLVDGLAINNELNTTGNNHPSLMQCVEGVHGFLINKNERPLPSRTTNLEVFSFETRGIEWCLAVPSMTCVIASHRSISEALEPNTACQNQVDADTAPKQSFSEANPRGHQSNGCTIDLKQHKIKQESQHKNSEELNDIAALTSELNSKYTESIQDTLNYAKKIRADKLKGKDTHMRHMHSNYFQPKTERSFPRETSNIRPGSEPNFNPSDGFPNVFQEWLKQSAKLQVPREPSSWPTQDFVEMDVKSELSDSCFPETLKSHSPACRYHYTPERFSRWHTDYLTSRSNPLVQSCPSFANPFLYSECQQVHCRNHCSDSSHVMVSSEERKPFRPSGAASGSTCLPYGEQLPGSRPICLVPNDNVMQSYQCSSPALNDYSQCPSKFCPRPLEEVQPDDCRGGLSKMRPKKLLWLSEEEAEIIRLIRLSQVKDLTRCSSVYHASEQDSSALSARTERDIQEEVNLNEGRDASYFSSRVSSSSVEDLAFKAAEGYLDTNCTVRPDEDQHFSVDNDSTTFFLEQRHKQDVSQKNWAASCIQHFWRTRTQRRNKEFEEKRRLEALKFIFEMPAGQEHLLQMAVTAMTNGQLLSWHASIQKAAKVIQQAWQEASKRKKETLLAPETLPQDLKEFHKLIVWRHSNKGFAPPTYERFVRITERLKATTEGARIRRRLKSRRLQTIVKEIREIRVVLQELSGEAGLEPTLNLLPQLSMQLQQKLLQLQTALSGPQDAARVLLRRCPATPLVLCSSKNVQAEVTGLQSPCLSGDAGSLNQPLGKSFSESSGLFKKSGVLGAAHGKPLIDSFASSQKLKHQTQPRVSNISGANNIHGNCGSFVESDLETRSHPKSRVELSKSDGSESQLLPAKTIKQTSGNEGTHERKAHSENPSSHFSSLETNVDKMPRESSAIVKSERAIEQWQNSSFLSIPEKASDVSSVKSSSATMEDSDYEDMSQNLDMPKHPFLRRKSKAMPPQKLDWSKVKPMVSSRLEPELKTRLLKAKFRGTALFRKRNFSQIKSRLFSYEKSGPEENYDIMKDSQFRHDRAESEGVDQKIRSLTQKYTAVDNGVHDKSACNTKVHRSKQPSLRYFPTEGLFIKDGTREKAEAECDHSLSACSSGKLRGKNVGKKPDVCLIDPPCERDWFGELENRPRSQGHPRRYGSPESVSDARDFERLSSVPTNYKSSRPGKRADLLLSKLVDQPLSELEKMFDDVIIRQGREVSLAAYFGLSQQDSIVPGLHPNSNVFETSRHKMTQTHRLLGKEGCAGRLQHNCLSFVSIRD